MVSAEQFACHVAATRVASYVPRQMPLPVCVCVRQLFYPRYPPRRNARWKEPTYLTAPSSRYRLRCERLCVAWCPIDDVRGLDSESQDEEEASAVSPQASTEEASLFIVKGETSEDIASHWMDGPVESVASGRDEATLFTPSPPRPLLTPRRSPESLTSVILYLTVLPLPDCLTRETCLGSYDDSFIRSIPPITHAHANHTIITRTSQSAHT